MRRKVMDMADERLSKVREINDLINEKLSEAESIREDMVSMRSMDYTKDRVQSSPEGGASFEDLVSRLDEKNREVDELIDKLNAHKDIIFKQISVMPEQYKSFLEMYYVELIPIEKVAGFMKMNTRAIESLRDYALLSYYTIYMK